MSNGENDGGEHGENAEIPASGSGSARNSEFDAPPVPAGAESNKDFDPPPFDDTDENDDGDEMQSDANSERILSVKAQIENQLVRAASDNYMSMAEARNIDSAGVLGVGVSAGAVPGQSSLVVYIEHEGNEEQVRRELVDTMGVQAASSDNLSIEVQVTGPIEALTSNRSRFRPAPAGASVGHVNITAGTIGGWAVGNGERSRRQLMVSNNHVLANSNAGRFGDSIIQPGSADGGTNPADRIAILERFVSINFATGAKNYVDCATGWCWPDRIRRDYVYHRGGATAKFFNVGNKIIQPGINMVVGKTGRTTDLTQGTIRATGVSVNVNFGIAGVAHFQDQFSVQSTGASDFSAGGDSGSFVWQWKSGTPIVGLLFAGGGGTTFCNRMSRVISALDIKLNNL